ncbi:MAG: cupin domain-containing protein [Archangium sp.]
MKKRLITADEIEAEAKKGAKVVFAPRAEAIVTPAAWSRARELGIEIDQDANGAAGVRVVRGSSVQLERFAGAGAGKNVQLKDVITAADRSPMGAGFMAWSAADSFPWELTYDEVDYVLEGELHVVIDGKTIEAKAGDVVFIPKGSKIIFGTPSRVRLFYVTHPASWAG